MKIALVSDMHIPDRLPALPPPLLSHLQTVDLILHAGDFICRENLTHPCRTKPGRLGLILVQPQPQLPHESRCYDPGSMDCG